MAPQAEAQMPGGKMRNGTLLLIAALLLVAAGAHRALAAQDQTAVAYILERYTDKPEPGAKARY